MIPTTDPITATRAEALFVSPLSAGRRPDRAQVHAAVRTAIDTLGPGGCAAEVAGEYGEHPECAARRMRWARAVVDEVYGRTGLALAG